MASLSNIMAGIGTIKVADSSTYIGTNTVALGAVDALGINVECSILASFNNTKRRPVGYKYIKDILRTAVEVVINMRVVEASQANLNLLFGGDGSSGNFYIDAKNNYLRTEVVFIYPDQTTTASFIFPKCILDQPDDLDLRNASDPYMPGLSFHALYPNNASWTGYIGRVIFS